MSLPIGMQVAFQGKAADMREIARLLTEHGVGNATGPMPGGG